MPVPGEGVSKQICSENRSCDTMFVTRNIEDPRFHPRRLCAFAFITTK